MNKCKWEGNDFEYCETLNTVVNEEKHGLWGNRVMVYCPFCGGSLKKPVVIEVGMFGMFHGSVNDLSGVSFYNVLDEIIEGEKFKYSDGVGGESTRFSPGLPSGYNQDGSKK